MFETVVRYFGFLKHVPLLPHLFDAFLMIEKTLLKPQVLGYIDDIEKQVLSWSGVSAGKHCLGGIQFNLKGKEIGHIHSNGMLDILFDKNISASLIHEGKAAEHHTFKRSGWISFLIRNENDKRSALELLEFSMKLRAAS